MSLKDALQAFIGRGKVRQWSEAELAARRAALESTLTGKPLAVADALAVSEYLFQRYLPQDASPTRAQWARFKAKTRRRLRDAETAGELTEAALESHLSAQQKQHERRRQLLLHSYRMPETDFIKVIGSLLAQAGYHLTARRLSRLYRATDPDWRAARGAADDLIGEVDPGLIAAARAWRANYQLLRCARNAGYTWIEVSPSYGCGCRAGVPRLVHRTEDMLRAFEGDELQELVFPSPHLPCLGADSPSACASLLHPSDDAELSVDPQFEQWLQDMAKQRAGRHRPPMETDDENHCHR